LQRGQFKRSEFLRLGSDSFSASASDCGSDSDSEVQTLGLRVCYFIGLPFIIIVFLLGSPFFVFAYTFFYTISDILGTSTSFPADATHVPTFYVPQHRYPKYLHILLLMALGTIFGGIHCAGWNFLFPTYAEQKLWRVASVGVTIFPIAGIPIIPIALTVILIIALLIILIPYIVALVIMLIFFLFSASWTSFSASSAAPTSLISLTSSRTTSIASPPSPPSASPTSPTSAKYRNRGSIVSLHPHVWIC